MFFLAQLKIKIPHSNRFYLFRGSIPRNFGTCELSTFCIRGFAIQITGYGNWNINLFCIACLNMTEISTHLSIVCDKMIFDYMFVSLEFFKLYTFLITSNFMVDTMICLNITILHFHSLGHLPKSSVR